MPVYSYVLCSVFKGGFVGVSWCAGCMPRRRSPRSPTVVHRTARAGLRVTRGQRRRLLGLLVSAGDVWAAVLELNAWRRARQDLSLVSYQALFRELACAGPGTFGDLVLGVLVRGTPCGGEIGGGCLPAPSFFGAVSP
jgi:hypothetical protein